MRSPSARSAKTLHGAAGQASRGTPRKSTPKGTILMSGKC